MSAPPEPGWPGGLVEVRAALAAGAAPAAALGTLRDGPLAGAAAAARLGRPLVDVAAGVDTGDARADLLVRALAVAEAAGAGAVAAVDQARRAAEQDEAVARALRVSTTQARQTAVVLTLVPATLWLLFVLADPRVLRFYAHPLGLTTGVTAVALALGGQWWARRLVSSAARAAAMADPLMPSLPRRDPWRALALAAPALAVGYLAGPAVGLASAGVAGAIGLRGSRADRAARRGARRAAAAAGGGGAAETAELVAAALAAGTAPVAGVALVAPVAPPLARPALEAAARRLRGGWAPAEAFAGTGLAVLGAALDASVRWGSPAREALASLADDLRARRRAAAEEAAERTQVFLVFPTTLLTLPAFVLAVVPPLVWTAFVR